MKWFKIGVELFNNKYVKYGGHTHWLGGSFLFSNRWIHLDYLIIELKLSKYFWKRYGTYYDGYHHSLEMWLLGIYWGGSPCKLPPEKTKAEIRRDKIKKLL